MFDAPRDRLAVPLDVPDLAHAERLIAQLDGTPGWLKVGLELFVAQGAAAVEAAAKHARVFLDLKLHDIPNTVAGAAASATRLGVGLLTVHTIGGLDMLRAAREGAEDAAAVTGTARPAIVGVTVLTSLDAAALARTGVARGIPDQVARLVDLAREAGIDGVVASAHEAAAVRAQTGDGFVIVTPGVRPAGASADDQARVATPADAISRGADLLVVGRPISRASDPAAAARAVIAEITQAARAQHA